MMLAAFSRLLLMPLLLTLMSVECLVISGERFPRKQTGFFHSNRFKEETNKSVNPFTADPVKALHFAILV